MVSSSASSKSSRSSNSSRSSFSISSSRRAIAGTSRKLDDQPICTIPLEVMQDSTLSALSRLAYGTLASFCAPKSNTCSVSLIQIAGRMGVTPQNVSRLIQNLEESQAITVERESVRGKPNRYVLNRGT
jgi:DNA-binding MarR family transcriptional regulator